MLDTNDYPVLCDVCGGECFNAVDAGGCRCPDDLSDPQPPRLLDSETLRRIVFGTSVGRGACIASSPDEIVSMTVHRVWDEIERHLACHPNATLPEDCPTCGARDVRSSSL